MRTTNMNNSIIDTELEFQILRYLRSALLKHGRSLGVPEGVEITKTYAWRSLHSFANKMRELNIKNEHLSMIINELVKYAHRNNLLSRGYNILCNKNIVEIIIKRLQKDTDVKRIKIEILQKTKNFLNEKIDNKDLCSLLQERLRIDTYSNFTKWYEQGHISVEYISVSKTCLKILNKLNDNERNIIPKPLDLLKTRIKLLSDKESIATITELMGEDYCGN